MNEVINTMLSHRSIRAFQNRPVDENHLDWIIRAVQASPSWINGQHYSIVAVKDPQRIKRLAELCGNQKHVREAPLFLVFCADFYRIHLAGQMENIQMKAFEDIDILLVGVTDAGIALGTAIAAAESLGLGTVPIGAIRKHSMEVVKELQLPEYVIPVAGLCLGYPAEDPGQKPRLPKKAVYHEETYRNDLIPDLEQYNEVYEKYLYERTNGDWHDRWTKLVASYYEDFYYHGVRDMLNRQKFPVGPKPEKRAEEKPRLSGKVD